MKGFTLLYLLGTLAAALGAGTFFGGPIGPVAQQPAQPAPAVKPAAPALQPNAVIPGGSPTSGGAGSCPRRAESPDFDNSADAVLPLSEVRAALAEDPQATALQASLAAEPEFAAAESAAERQSASRRCPSRVRRVRKFNRRCWIFRPSIYRARCRRRKCRLNRYRRGSCLPRVRYRRVLLICRRRRRGRRGRRYFLRIVWMADSRSCRCYRC